MSTQITHEGQDKVVAGVASRVGRRLGLDTVLVRAGFFIGLLIEPVTTMLIYFGLAYILPRTEGQEGESSSRSGPEGVPIDFGATVHDAVTTGARLASVTGDVVLSVGRAGVAAGRAATVAGNAAFRTSSPARRRRRRGGRRRGRRTVAAPTPATLPRQTPATPPVMRTARTAAYAPSTPEQVARQPRMAPLPAAHPRPVAPPRTPRHRVAAPRRRVAPPRPGTGPAPAPKPPKPTAAPQHARTWLSDEERLEVEVRTAVARTEAKARQDLAATEAAARQARRLRRRRRFRRTFGALAVAGGTLWLAAETGLMTANPLATGLQNPTAWAIALMAGGAWMVLSSLWRR